MLAVDTNILVRFLANDDARQSALVRNLFLTEKIWIAKTVLLETDWVLRKVYGLDESAIRFALSRVLALPGVKVEDVAAVSKALLLGDHGIDFADALHLSSRPSGAGFVTFDRPLLRKAKRAGEQHTTSLPI
jgi:predicted nucleic-acid-binding protein